MRISVDDDQILKMTMKMAQYCDSIEIDGQGGLTFQYLRALDDWLSKTSKITSFTLSDNIFNESPDCPKLDSICKYFSELKVFRLEPNYSGLPSRLALDLVEQVLQQCPKIEQFSEQIFFGIPWGYFRDFGKHWKYLHTLKINTEGISLRKFGIATSKLHLKSLSVTHFSDSLLKEGNVSKLVTILSMQKVLHSLYLDFELTTHRDGMSKSNLMELLKSLAHIRKFVYKVSIESFIDVSFAVEKMQFELWTKKSREYSKDSNLPIEYFDIVNELAVCLEQSDLNWELHWNY